MKTRTVAVIPAKGTSVRVPGKNLLTIDSLTLVERKIRELKKVEGIDQIIVGSDSAVIRDLAESCGALPLIRDDYHCDESRCSANEMIHDLIGRVEADLIVWAHCTNPFVLSETFRLALLRYHDGLAAGHDSLVSVTRMQGHFWNESHAPINFEPLADPHQLASTLPSLFAQDGAIFVQPRPQMLSNRYFYGGRPFLFEIDPIEGFDINTPGDIEVARRLSDLFPSMSP